MAAGTSQVYQLCFANDNPLQNMVGRTTTMITLTLCAFTSGPPVPQPVSLISLTRVRPGDGWDGLEVPRGFPEGSGPWRWLSAEVSQFFAMRSL